MRGRQLHQLRTQGRRSRLARQRVRGVRTLDAVSVHPEVTDATAKELYANAIRCAHPECSDPLYRKDTDGSRSLNSRISHICARSKNGPRWNEKMGPEENRSANNLVLLCLFHADLIDRKDRVIDFPAEMLVEWKAAQIEEYDQAVEAGQDAGYTLTDEEAKEVIEKSERTTNITLTADTIIAGGMGGQAIGSAGGGGAAIGTGSLVGGKGGDVQNINLAGQPGQDYGAGGGGGTAVVYEGPTVPHTGGGTEGRAYIAGQDGADSGDAVFTSGDFELTASGGKGGLAGSGNRKLTEKLRVSSLMLANYAAVDRGLIHIINGAWQNISVILIPSRIPLPVFAVIEAGGVDPGEYTVAFEARNPSGEVRATASFALVVEEQGDLVRVPCAFGLEVEVDELGLWRVTARSDMGQLGAIEVMIKQPVAD
jgi:hypothetical protein